MNKTEFKSLQQLNQHINSKLTVQQNQAELTHNKQMGIKYWLIRPV